MRTRTYIAMHGAKDDADKHGVRVYAKSLRGAQHAAHQHGLRDATDARGWHRSNFSAIPVKGYVRPDTTQPRRGE